MTTVEEALRLIQEEQKVVFDSESIATSKALNRVLSKSIQAPLALPSFKQSAMDGYALHIGTGLNYEVVGEQKAGDANTFELEPWRKQQACTSRYKGHTRCAFGTARSLSRLGTQRALFERV